jgi:hypothetical protein
MSDLIERLRAATMGFDWSDISDDALLPAIPLLREAATALSQEREAREKAERKVQAFRDDGLVQAAIARQGALQEERDEWQRRAERAENALPGELERRAQANYVTGLEASLAEAKRLLKPFADLARAIDELAAAGQRKLQPEESASLSDREIADLVTPGSNIVATDGRMAFGHDRQAAKPVAITVDDVRAAARFLSQEPNHER